MNNTLNIEEELAFAASFGAPEAEAIADGFNEYGVRENYGDDGELQSLDVNYEAMQPGEPENRNGVRITEEFLRTVAEKDYDSSPPFMMDHNRETLSKAGDVLDVWFSDSAGKLMVQSRIPNTGADTHDELISRFTHDPPTVTNGSVGFGNSYEAIENDDGEPELIDAKLQEFSTTPFPGGYDDGGLRAAFAESAVEATSYAEHSYQHEVGDWVSRSYSGGSVKGKVRARSRGSYTVDGNTVGSEDDDKPVYKMEEYKDGDFTGQMIAAKQSSVSTWQGPQDSSESDAYLALTFESDSDELDEVYSDWSDAVNMSASQLESWADHDCADTASQNPSKVRKRNMRLLEKNKSDWTSDDIDDAKRTISFISRMRGQKPDSPAEGGKGTCPSEWAVSLLNWAYNPFDGMPSGTPEPDGENSVNVTTTVYSMHGEEGEMDSERDNMKLNEVYAAYQNATNMTDEELRMWDRHPCADAGNSNQDESRVKAQMLAGSPKQAWDAEFVLYAIEAIDFIEGNMDRAPERPEAGSMGSCPSKWAIQMMNRGYNPFDGMPDGRPHNGYPKAKRETYAVDDIPQEETPSGDGIENSEVAVFAEEL